MKKPMLFTALVLVAGVFGCSKKDKENPVIKVSSPAHEEVFTQGGTINFEATFTDNEALGEYKVDIHMGDGHSHKTTDISHDWDFEKIEKLEGTEQKISFAIEIENDAKAGEYHFIVNATDKAGNEADFVEIAIDIVE